MQRGILAADCIGVPTTIAVYLTAAWVVARGRPDAPPAAPTGVIVVQIIGAVVAAFALYVNALCQPYPRREDKVYNAVAGPFGRWIFLTRQTLALQAVHFTVSVLAPFSSLQLTTGTYIWAVYLGGQGLFVTIQFFTLVTPNPEYKKACLLWASRGVNFKAIGLIAHIPAGCLAIMDICVFKSRVFLEKVTPSVQVLLLVYLVYIVFYLTVIFVNFKVTAHWPYELMYNFGVSILKWARFIAVQYVVLAVFLLIMVCFSKFAPAVW